MLNQELSEFLDDFLLESGERVDRVEQILLSLPDARAADREGALLELKRELHTLKGNAGMMGLDALQSLSHELEDAVELLDPEQPDVGTLLAGLDRLRAGLAAPLEDQEQPTEEELQSGAATDGGIRIASRQLDDLADHLAQLLSARIRLAEAVRAGAALDLQRADFRDLSRSAWRATQQALEEMEQRIGTVQEAVLDLRMVPVGRLIGRLQRIVHDEAERTGKSIAWRAEGGDTKLDKALVEFAGDALGHLVRNAAVHAIEGPERRRELGKPEEGTVRLSAAVETGMVQIDVIDDGAGLDQQALARAAQRMGLDEARLDDLRALVFLPGLSTRDQADLGAGRGMGLASVAESAHRLGGSIDLASTPGEGTHFQLRLPLSVSIVAAMLVTVDGETYALPATSLVETLDLAEADLVGGDSGEVLRWRNREMEVADLGVVFGTATMRRRSGFVAVLIGEGRLYGIVVDSLGEMQDIVIKGLDPDASRSPGISGSTILADGRPILILDPTGLASLRLKERVAV